MIVEPDNGSFIARCPDISVVYGFGDDLFGAVESLKREIESLYEDLVEDDDFTDEWMEWKALLKQLIEAPTDEERRLRDP